MPESLEQLDLLLIHVAKTRRVQQDGIHFQGQCYFDLTLAAYVGEDVLIWTTRMILPSLILNSSPIWKV